MMRLLVTPFVDAARALVCPSLTLAASTEPFPRIKLNRFTIPQWVKLSLTDSTQTLLCFLHSYTFPQIRYVAGISWF